jgi:riboflavin kinase/FMN adenylyltransferase
MKIFSSFESFNEDKKIVLTLGNFDGLHLGHRKIINKVIEIGKHYNLPTALLTFSIHPMKHFGSDILEIQTIKQKLEMLQSIGLNYVLNIPFNHQIANMAPGIFVREILVKKLHSRFIVVGYDFHFGRKRKGNFELLDMMSKKYGYNAFKVDKVVVDGITVSSTNIRKFLKEGNIKQASKLLGRQYSLSGNVIKGDGIGRLIGYPTANIDFGNIITPKNGVYATMIKIGNEVFPSVTNVGIRPTVTNSEELRVETHILDFNRDIYYQTVHLDFIELIREEVKFNSFDELKKQIKIDCKNVKKLVSI